MTLTQFLEQQIAAGVHRIGQVEILSEGGRAPFRLCHVDDREAAAAPDAGALEVFDGPGQARELSTWGDDGGYRFSKAQTNLRRGWLMRLAGVEDLRRALEGFYPAAVGLWRALGAGQAEPQHLRDKLERQTGMYRYARNVSDEGAQRLVRDLCGPAHQCAKRILWQLDARTPLDDSEARRFRGVLPGVPEAEAIPLVCREACNFFVAECRVAAKREFEAAQAGG